MQMAKLSGRICRQCAEIRLSNSAGPSRGMSILSRRRQKRNMSAQASMAPSQQLDMDQFPFQQMPPRSWNPIDWEGKGKAVAEKEVQQIFSSLIDRKGKGRAVEEVTTSNRQTVDRFDYEVFKSEESEFAHLFAPKTASLSLNLMQKHCNELKDIDTSYQLRLITWLIDLTKTPKNDVLPHERRWHVSVYRRARLEKKQGIQPEIGTMPTSIDLLCADLLREELQRDFSHGDVGSLRKLAFQALRRNGFRTVQAIEDMLQEDETFNAIERSRSSLNFFLRMKECFFIGQAKRGQWFEVWQQKDEIIALLRRQKDLGQLFKRDTNDNWRMDVVLMKSLSARCAYHVTQRRRVSRSLRVDLASDKYYMKQVSVLQEELKEIYGEITDKCLTNFILGLKRGLDSQSDLHNLSLIDYFDRLALTNLAQRLFEERCQGKNKPSAELLEGMLALEVNWERHCRAYRGMRGGIRMRDQAKKHHENAKGILQLLSEHHHRVATTTTGSAPLATRRQVMEDLQGKAMAMHISIKLLLSRGDLTDGLQRLQDYLDTVRPDEDYFHLTGARFMPSMHSQQATTAKSMMKSRRLTRGSFVSIALELNKGDAQDKGQYIPVLLQLIKDSIERGVWDPWPIKKNTTRKRVRFINFRPHLVDPTGDLSALCNRLLAMCKPVSAVHRDSVVPGYTITDSSLASIYYLVLEGIALLHKTMESRIGLLQEKGLVNLPENITRSRNTLRDIFVERGASSAQCIWAALSNPSEKDLIAPRLEFLFEQIFVPLCLPKKGWTSAELAIKQEWPSHANSFSMKNQVLALFEEAYQKRLKVAPFGDGPSALSSLSEEGRGRTMSRAILRHRQRRIRLKERKSIAKERRLSRALFDRTRR
jgi:hypothetical protein